MTRKVFVTAAILVFVVVSFLFFLYSFVGKGYWVIGVGPIAPVEVSSGKTWQHVITKGGKNSAFPFLVFLLRRPVPSRQKLAIWLPDKQSGTIPAGCDEPRRLLGIFEVNTIYFDPQLLRTNVGEGEANKELNVVIVRCVLYAILKPQGASLFLEKVLSDIYDELGQPNLVRFRK